MAWHRVHIEGVALGLETFGDMKSLLQAFNLSIGAHCFGNITVVNFCSTLPGFSTLNYMMCAWFHKSFVLGVLGEIRPTNAGVQICACCVWSDRLKINIENVENKRTFK